MTYEKNEQPQGTDVPREQPEQSERKDGSMSIIAHLEELRKRLIYSIAAVVVGIAFSFALVLPAAIRFFIGFGSDNLEPLFSLGKYLDFVLAFILPFGFIFELPLVIVILAKLGFVGSAFLWKQQRIVVFLSFVIGAVISPTPDVFSQTMIAVPMILLYEISYVIVRFILRK